MPRPTLQIPQYFSAQKFEIGQLVEVPLGKRKTAAVIYKRSKAEAQKANIKKSPYALKNIDSELTNIPVFPKHFLDLAVYLSDYYFAPTGLMLQRMLPPFFSKPTRPLLEMLNGLSPWPKTSHKKKKREKVLLIGKNPKKHYEKYLEKSGVFYLAPQYLYLQNAKDILKKNSLIINKNITGTTLREEWRKAYSGEIKNIAGTRGALFFPFKNLETIIVDNENNNSHVSWDLHPKFDARYAAELIAEYRNANIVESDSLPSIEKYYKAKNENWNVVKNPQPLKEAKIIDMREELKAENMSILSREVKELLKNADKKSKIFLFITRRGLSSALVCRDCGHVVQCPDCEVAMVLHEKTPEQRSNLLVCHRCSKRLRAPRSCPKCESYRIKELGGGTQRVAKEVEKIAPHLKTIRLDSDVTRSPDEQMEVFRKFREEDINILIGTHAAVKERMLPSLDYAVAVMLDTALYLPQYRSTEQVFEIIWRLRCAVKNSAIVQTYHPEFPVFSYALENDFENFFKEELRKREIINLPPYSQIIRMSFGHKNPEVAEREAQVLKRKLEVQMQHLKVEGQVMGPAPAFVPKIAGKYIWYILIKWGKNEKGEVENLPMRNELLNIVPKGWEVVIDPVDAI